MDLERQKEHFRNHKAKFTDYGDIKILDFKNPETSHYRIRFLFEEEYYRLHISGDLGELIATNYKNMTFDKFDDFVNNTGYFEEKIDCHNRSIYVYDEELARKELKEYIEENDLLYYEDDETELEDILDNILAGFSEESGISSNGYDELSKLDEESWEIACDLGKKSTGILDLYMLAFKLAKEQINGGK